MLNLAYHPNTTFFKNTVLLFYNYNIFHWQKHFFREEQNKQTHQMFKYTEKKLWEADSPAETPVTGPPS